MSKVIEDIDKDISKLRNKKYNVLKQMGITYSHYRKRIRDINYQRNTEKLS